MSEYFWLSYPLTTDTPAYGGEKGFYSDSIKRISEGDTCNTSSYRLTSHTGTHVDTAKHFFDNGLTVEAFEPEFWIFNQVQVIEVNLTKEKNIVQENAILPLVSDKTDLILIKTGMSHTRGKKDYWEYNPGLEPELGRKLRNNYPFLRAIGVDSISISSWQNRQLGREAHRAFLDPKYGDKFVLIEDMDLSKVHSNTEIYKVYIMPLLVQGADGAPCNVLAQVK